MKVIIHDLHEGNITLEVQVNKTKPISFISMTVAELSDLQDEIDKQLKKLCKKSSNIDEDYCSGDVCRF